MAAFRLDLLPEYIDTAFLHAINDCGKEVIAGSGDALNSFQQVHSRFSWHGNVPQPPYDYIARYLVEPMIERLPSRCVLVNPKKIPVSVGDEVRLTQYGILTHIIDNDVTVTFHTGVKEVAVPQIASFLPAAAAIEAAMEPRMPRAASHDTVVITGIEQKRTDKAVLVRIMRIMGVSCDDTTPSRWIPLSQIISRENSDHGESTFTVSAWIARKILQEIREEQGRGEVVARTGSRPNTDPATLTSIAEEFNLPSGLLAVLQAIESGAPSSYALPSDTLSLIHGWLNTVISRLSVPTYLDDRMIRATLMHLRSRVRELISRNVQASRQERELRYHILAQQLRTNPGVSGVSFIDDTPPPPASPPVIICTGRVKRKFKLDDES